MKVDVSALRQMSLEDLRRHWRTHCKGEVPHHASRDLLVRAIVYQHAAAMAGGSIAKRAQRRLETMSAAPTIAARPRLSPGVVLVREWNGVPHAVTVAQGGFLWEGKHYASLSAVATAITGVRWNGPRFFKLDDLTTENSP